MEELRKELIAYDKWCETLPFKDVKLSSEELVDKYLAINGNEPTRELLSENKEVEDCKLNRQPTECSIYLYTKGGCTNCGHYQS